MPLFKSFLCSARKLKVNSVKVMELLCLWVLCQGERCSRGFHQLLFFSEKKKNNKKKINTSLISNQTEGKEENRKSEESFTASSSSLKVWSPVVLVSALLGLGTAARAVPCQQLAPTTTFFLHAEGNFGDIFMPLMLHQQKPYYSKRV